jgi:hypothetical protein
MTNKKGERRLSSSAFTFLFYEKQRQLSTNTRIYNLPKIKSLPTVNKDLWVLS